MVGDPQRRQLSRSPLHREPKGEAYGSLETRGFTHVSGMKADYRGELKVILLNHGIEPFAIQRGDRVAQLVLAPVVQAAWDEVESLDETARGTGGFGSTGGHARL